MRSTIFLLSVLLAIGCDTPRTQQNVKAPVANQSRYAKFLAKFKEKTFDTLYVHSPIEVEGELVGIELDSNDAALLPQETFKEYQYEQSSLYAVYRFNMGDNVIGLIARTPAMYAPTSIKFFRYDKKKDAITSVEELAENWGDAGDYLGIESWMFRDSSKLMAFKTVLEGHDPSVGDYDTTAVLEETHSYFLLDLSGEKVRTISDDSTQLKNRFSHLLKQ